MKGKISVLSIAICLVLFSCGENKDGGNESGIDQNATEQADNSSSQSSSDDLNEEKMKSELSAFLGDKTNRVPARLAELKKGMSGDEVRAILPSLEEVDPEKKFAFVKAKVDNDVLIKRYKVTFKSGKLEEVTTIFHDYLDKEMFGKVALELFQGKWGELKEKDKSSEIWTWINLDFEKVQASYFVDHWQVATEIL